MIGTIEWAVRNLKAGAYTTCKQLFDDLASAYGQYIRIQDNETLSSPEFDYIIKNKDKRRFSLRRKTNHWSLYIDGRYAPYIPRVLSQMGVDSIAEAQGKSHFMKLVTHEHKTVKLTEAVGVNGKLQWRHTPLENLPLLFQEAEIYFQKVMDLKTKVKNEAVLNEAIRSIAAIHWIYVHATPILRGTAGTSDMLSKTLFDYLKIDVPEWKQGLAPDLEALVTPLEIYVNHYRDFFDGELKFQELNRVV